VFYCDDWWWIDEFLAKNQRYYIEPVSQKVQHGATQLLKVKPAHWRASEQSRKLAALE
jgi:hypothetical protein